MNSVWTLNEVEPVFGLLPDEAVLCGGQAVAFWAWRYGLTEVVSKDVDFLGDRSMVFRLAKLRNGSTYFPHPYEMTSFCGRATFFHLGRTLEVEFLHSIPGLGDDTEEISVKAVSPGGIGFRVLDPVSLCQSKLHNLRHFAQEFRNDLSHLRTAMKAASLWLAALFPTEPATALIAVNSWFRSVRVRGYLRTLLAHDVDWTTAIPVSDLETLRSSSPKVEAFLSQQWPRMTDTIRQRATELDTQSKEDLP